MICLKSNVENLLIANMGSDSLSIMDLATKRITDTIFLKPLLNIYRNKLVNINGSHVGPYKIAKSGHYKYIIYIVNTYHDSIFKIDIKKKVIEDIVYVGCSPCHIDKSDEFLFVTNSDSNSVSIIDEETFKLVEDIPVSDKPHDIKLDKKNGNLYIASTGSSSIEIINIKNHNNKSIKLDCNPLHLFLYSNQLFILGNKGNGIYESSFQVLDVIEMKVKDNIQIEGVISGLEILNENTIFVTNMENGYLYRLNIEDNKIEKKYHLGGMPNTLLLDNCNELLYITNTLDSKVIIFDYNKEKVIKKVEVGKEPSGMILY